MTEKTKAIDRIPYFQGEFIDRKQLREIYLTTPPKEGAPAVRFENSNSGIYCSSGAFRRNEFTWSSQEKRWQQTNSELVIISGGRF